MADLVVQGQRLPGIGWRYDVPVGDGGNQLLVIVVEDRGPRHIMLFDERADGPLLNVRLSHDHAAAIAALLTGARFAVAPAEVTEGQIPSGLQSTGVVVDTLDVNEPSPVIGLQPRQFLAMFGEEVALLGVLDDETPGYVEDDPARPVRAGDRLVVAARCDALDRVRRGF